MVMDLQFFGGRGASSGIGSKPAKNVRTVDGIRGSVFSTFSDVSSSSQNTIWIENTSRPHAMLKFDNKTIQVKGSKKEKYGLLDKVNTAVVYLSGISEGNPTREVNRLNKHLNEIRALGFDIPKINVGRDETIAYVKRILFTRQY